MIRFPCPPGEVDEAVVVDAGEVAGVQPALAQLAQPVQHGPSGPRSTT
jgi:hypothetical protein